MFTGSEKYTIQPEGKLLVNVAPDGSLAVSSEQHININLGTIKSVGVENICDIEAHCINRFYNSVSHFIKFIGGGEVKFAFNSHGNIMELTGTDIAVTITNGDRLIFKRKTGGIVA